MAMNFLKKQCNLNSGCSIIFAQRNTRGHGYTPEWHVEQIYQRQTQKSTKHTKDQIFTLGVPFFFLSASLGVFPKLNGNTFSRLRPGELKVMEYVLCVMSCTGDVGSSRNKVHLWTFRQQSDWGEEGVTQQLKVTQLVNTWARVWAQRPSSLCSTSGSTHGEAAESPGKAKSCFVSCTPFSHRTPSGLMTGLMTECLSSHPPSQMETSSGTYTMTMQVVKEK